MAQITVKYDPALEIEPIEDLMYATNPNEDPTDSTAPEVQQTKITGVVAPLIKVNKIEAKTFNGVKIGYRKEEIYKLKERLERI